MAISIGTGITIGGGINVDTPYDASHSFLAGEQGFWLDPSDLSDAKLTYKRNLVEYSENISGTGWVSAGSQSAAGVVTLPVSIIAARARTTLDRPVFGNLTASVWVPPAVNWSDPNVSLDISVAGLGIATTLFTPATVNAGAGGWVTAVLVQPTFYTLIDLRIRNNSAATVTCAIPMKFQMEVGTSFSGYQAVLSTWSSQLLQTYPQHSLYQDSNGYTPITTMEQPLGLILDKSRGVTSGPNLIANGVFTSDLTGWFADPGFPPASFTFVAGSMYVVGSGGTYSGVKYPISTVIGMTYLIISDISVPGTGYVTTSNTSASGWSPTSGSGSRVFIATATTTYIVVATGGTSAFYIKNISVVALPGRHFIQPTTTKRPVLSARVNLLTYSEDFSNALWIKNVTSVNYLGAGLGYSIIPTVTSTYHSVSQTLSLPAGTYTYTVRVASLGYNCYVQIANSISGGYSVGFDLTTGTITATAPYGVYGTGTALVSQSIVPVGGDWIISLTTTSTSPLLTAYICPVNIVTFPVFAGNGTSGIAVRYAQLELSQTTTPYQWITSASLYDTVGFKRYLKFDGVDDALYSMASIDFSTYTTGQSRRNLLTYPTAFDNAAWVKVNSTITPNAIAAPDGTITADRLVETAATGLFYCSQNITTTVGTNITGSLYAKASGRDWLQLLITGVSSIRVWVNLQTGAIGTVTGASPSVVSVVDAGNGWWRVIITAPAALTTVIMYPCTGDVDNNQAIVGDITKGIYIWGAQLEVGTSVTPFETVGTDKVVVVAGISKSNDTTGILLEHSVNSNVNNGSFFVLVGADNGLTNCYELVSRGTSSVTTGEGLVPAPNTSILLGTIDVTTSNTKLRRNYVVKHNSFSYLGSGNFGNYVTYIGSRGGTSYPFAGNLYNLIVRGALPSAQQIDTMEAFVTEKTGTLT
jgi:hypothetical protein